MNIEEFLRSLTTSVCLSGGARGSDIAWGNAAKRLGHKVLHWSFNDHRSTAAENELIRLNESQLLSADAAVLRANKTLMRNFPTNLDFVNNLLRRDWYQIAWTDSVYAVGYMNNACDISEGTAWTVAMYLDRFRYDNEPIEKCKIYFYDQNSKVWWTWKYEWQKCLESPPIPQGIWSGIGTRKLAASGSRAIAELMVNKTEMLQR